MTMRVVGLSLEGAQELKSKLELLREDIRGPILRNAVQEGAEPILADARARAPVLKSPALHRVAGMMRSLIKAWPARQTRLGKFTMQIGVDLRELQRFLPAVKRTKNDSPDFLYPLYEEYGTTKNEAQPFLRPAIDAQGDNAVKRVIAVIQRNLKRYEEHSG